MKWHELLNKVAEEPFFQTSFLMAGENLAQLRLQLSRWVKSGRLIQLRRGLYTLSSPYRKNTPHPFTLANTLKQASYVSLQSGLAFYNLIPEHVPLTTSITTKRPETIHTKLGDFEFRHIKKSLFEGFKQVEVVSNQFALIAGPEKSLFDLIHLTPGAESYNYLKELRLQNLDAFCLDVFNEFSIKSNSPKLLKASKNMYRLISDELSYKEL